MQTGRARVLTMCGRYTLTHPAEALAEILGEPAGTATAALAPRYNIAPTQIVPIVRRAAGGGREAALLRWGLVPAGAADPAVGSRLINARAETVATKPAFRDAFATRRCLVPADGFYEWRVEGRRRQPIYIHLPDGRPFAFAGLWSRWSPPRRGPVGPLETFTILTTEPGPIVAPIHDRMPLLLEPDQHEMWLAAPAGEVQDWLRTLRPNGLPLATHLVSPRVNSPKVDDPSCIAPLAGRQAPTLFDP